MPNTLRPNEHPSWSSRCLNIHMNNAAPRKVTIPNIGISVRSSYGPMTDPRVGAQHIIDRAAAAEASNLASLFLGDHHATPTPYYQNIPMMGRLLANWSGETTSNLLWEIERAVISLTPSEPIATWIGADTPISLKRVARMSHSWLADLGLTQPNLLKKRDSYLAACEAEGTEYPSQMAVRRDVHVADSDKEAAAVKAELEAKQYRGIDPDALVIGTVGQVEAHIRDLGEIAFTDIITRHLHPDQASAIHSIERLGHVRERLNARYPVSNCFERERKPLADASVQHH